MENIHQESLLGYFGELVGSALKNQRVDANDITVYYLIQLLAGFVRTPSRILDESITLQLACASDLKGDERRKILRKIGDDLLFLSGFFGASLSRRLIDLDYCTQIGSRAYKSLSLKDCGIFGSIFSELGSKFVIFVDVLSEVSESSGVASNVDLLKRYEEWLKTGSRRTGLLLTAAGIIPSRSSQRLN
jgi:hypothetical protein